MSDFVVFSVRNDQIVHGVVGVRDGGGAVVYGAVDGLGYSHGVDDGGGGFINGLGRGFDYDGGVAGYKGSSVGGDWSVNRGGGRGGVDQGSFGAGVGGGCCVDGLGLNVGLSCVLNWFAFVQNFCL